jgi:hypothetical protein
MSIVLLGSTSGSCTLQEQAVAGTTTLTLPTFNGTVGLLVSGTAVASTSGTSIDFTGIPAGVRRITVMFSGVSTNGSSIPQIQLGVSGTPETSSYSSMATYITTTNNTTRGTTATSGFILITATAASTTFSGSVVFTLLNSNTWTCVGTLYDPVGNGLINVSGGKSLAGVLNMVRITTVNGTDTFDAGSINILYE